jgi:hypothetical protein
MPRFGGGVTLQARKRNEKFCASPPDHACHRITSAEQDRAERALGAAEVLCSETRRAVYVGSNNEPLTRTARKGAAHGIRFTGYDRKNA